jgi:diguanylate cyclase (GGDEF)-like protein
MKILQERNDSFSTHRIFSDLSAAEIETLASRMAFLAFDPDEIIYSAGDSSPCMFFVISGQVSVLKPDDYGKEQEIARMAQGESLGELEMINDSPREVSAVSASASILARFPREGLTFRQLLDAESRTGTRILYGFIRDIAERTREANELLKTDSPHIQKLRRQVYEDKLTGLNNRSWLEENLSGFLAGTSEATALLMIKPDNFKVINDTAGHEAGDSLLVELAQRLPAVLPENAQLSRYLGNEFAVILTLKNEGKLLAKQTAEKIQNFYIRFDTSVSMAQPDFHLTVSIGIALYPEHAHEPLSLIQLAHQLPLEGRSRGGNLILFPEDRLDGHS